MEQFQQIGEVLGSLKALMVLQDEIQINPRQCCLLLSMFTLAFDVIAEEIKQNLKLEERSTKWKPLEEPLRELYRVLKGGESYIRRCLDNKHWWGKVISLHQSKDSLEFHIHNLLCHFPAVIEAIEIAGEISGLDQEEMQKKRVMFLRKYDRGWNDPKLFEWRFGRQYLVTPEMCSQFEKAVKEDRWLLVESIKEKKVGSLNKNEQRLSDMLLKKLNGMESVNGKLPPSSVLLGAEDYRVGRRLGEGRSQYKEIQWLGGSFALRHFFGDIEPLSSEISTLLSLSHPNIVQYLCGFFDEEKKECLLIMELMSKDLCSHIKENSSPRRRFLFPLPVALDIMLQVARGMEYLHSQKIYIGDLNPTKIFLKTRKVSDGYFHVKVSGFGLRSVKSQQSRNSSPDQNATCPHFWYAPEILEQQERPGSASSIKYTEKAEVYSFGMLCFELLTGKPPFEDGHLQGDQIINNLRAGERPLFPSHTPRYLANLTKKCWHTDPNSRPGFSSICRVLRYVKKFLVMNPNDDQPHIQAPLADYCDLEAGYLKRYTVEANLGPVSQIPFQMFVYRLLEKEKSSPSVKFKISELASEAALNAWDENTSAVEDSVAPGSDSKSVASDIRGTFLDSKSVCTEVPENNMPADLRSVCSVPADLRTVGSLPAEKKIMLTKKSVSVKLKNASGKPKAQTPPKTSPRNQSPQSWPRPLGRSKSDYTLRPLARSQSDHTLRTFRETSKQLSMSPMSPGRRRPSSIKATDLEKS